MKIKKSIRILFHSLKNMAFKKPNKQGNQKLSRVKEMTFLKYYRKNILMKLNNKKYCSRMKYCNQIKIQN
jgi:hypothetical protein